jgi:hypothetical protein
MKHYKFDDCRFLAGGHLVQTAQMAKKRNLGAANMPPRGASGVLERRQEPKQRTLAGYSAGLGRFSNTRRG